MTSTSRSGLWFAALFVAVLALLTFFAVTLRAQDPGVPVSTEVAAFTAAAELADFAAGLLAQYSWASTALAIFGALTIVYQTLIAWAHQRAAATASDADDKWLASLEAKWWFRLLDRIFYWGGYLGAKLGGRKL